MAKPTRSLEHTDEVKISMTPMIDVVFLLLVFFVVTMKFRVLEGKLDARLPDHLGQTNAPPERDEDLTPTRVRLTLLKVEPVNFRYIGRSPARVRAEDFDGPVMFHVAFSVGERRLLELVQRSEMVGGEQRTTIAWSLRGRPLRSNRQLLRALEQIQRQNPEAPAIIDPEPAVPYSALVSALEACRQAGYREVRFAGKVSRR